MKGETMSIKAWALLLLATMWPLSSMGADDTLARFRGGIGVHPVLNVSGTANAAGAFPEVTRNIVRNVNPAGQIWVISKLDARVRANGQITVDGAGLILGGGNHAGRASGQLVFATLICEAASPFTEHSTNATGVALTATGDFRLDDMLSPPVPFSCPSPMLLIRNAAGGTWFAVGNVTE